MWSVWSSSACAVEPALTRRACLPTSQLSCLCRGNHINNIRNLPSFPFPRSHLSGVNLQVCQVFGIDLYISEKSVSSGGDTGCVYGSGCCHCVKTWRAAYLSWPRIHHGRWEDGHHGGFRIQDAFLEHGGMLLHAPHQRNIIILCPASKRVEEEDWTPVPSLEQLLVSVLH